MFKQACKNLINALGVKTLYGSRVNSVLDYVVANIEVTDTQLKDVQTKVDNAQNKIIINTDVINKLIDVNNFTTSEFTDCTELSHKGTCTKIYILESVQKVPIIRSITLKIAADASQSYPVYIILTDKSQKVVIGKSNNSIIPSENKDKFVTWYFDYLHIPSGQLDIIFKNDKDEECSCRLHMAVKSEDIHCVNKDSEFDNLCPALGINTLTNYDR